MHTVAPHAVHMTQGGCSVKKVYMLMLIVLLVTNSVSVPVIAGDSLGSIPGVVYDFRDGIGGWQHNEGTSVILGAKNGELQVKALAPTT